MDTSSPVAASGSPTEEFLTPRSKVAKMLADIENAPTPSPSERVTSEALDGSVVSQPVLSSPAVSSSGSQRSAHLANDDKQLQSRSDSDDSDGDIRRPLGRAARRMLGAQGSLANRGSSPAETDYPSEKRNSKILDDEDDLYSSTPMKRTGLSRAISTSAFGSEKGNGLFVSPARSTGQDEDNEDELPANPLGDKDKLAVLVAQKRAERLAKEAEEDERRKHASSSHASSDLPDEVFEGSQEPADPDVEKIMSDASRPARKASKRALLEMERETQRLARQQALAHQMKVKKKFTTNDLFAKFNLRRPGAVAESSIDQSAEGDTTASSAPNSDDIEERTKDPVSTPPSSPPTPLDRQKALVDCGALSKLVPVRQDSIASLAEVDSGEELPDIADILKSSQTPRATQVPLVEKVEKDKKGLKLARLGRKAVVLYDDSSDDELDIIPTLPAPLRAFDRATGATRAGKPADSKAIHHLKQLSNLHANDAAPHKKGSHPSINPIALENQLRRQAKEQARKQQLERIEELKAKGIEVQTTEEREKEAEAFENLLEKARQDAVELRKAEKAALKEASGQGAVQPSDDEDEDEDHVGCDSEDEEMLEGADEDGREGNGMVDEAAEEIEDDEEVDAETESDVEKLEGDEPDAHVDDDEETVYGASLEDTVLAAAVTNADPAARKARKSRVVKDDDDEESDVEQDTDVIAETEPTETDPFAAFNFGVADNSLLSPTQAFNATMQTPTQATQEDSFDVLRRIAPPSASSLPPILPELDTQTGDESQQSFVTGSQVPSSQRISLDWEMQAPETPVPAGLNRGTSALSETPGWEPTQDPGLPSPWTVAPKMRRESTLNSIAEYDTQSTVQLRVSESPAPSHKAPRRGRLVRRQGPIADDSEDDSAAPAPSLKPEKRDAFREMARRRKEALTATERADAEREMREMMDEAAEESDDEYAGLGGDDFVVPETEQDKEMIDSADIDIDERAIAVHFAERQRLRDEAETSKLYKDLTTGMLRRKMGANAFDLDEDEDELAVRRRQKRQREEARKRKALLRDENVATLAEGRQNRGKDAFLKAIADDDGDEEVVNLSDGEDESAPATQDESRLSQSQRPEAGPLRETSGNKRRLAEHEEATEDRPAKQRKTQVSAFKRPTSLLDIKESVSYLLDEPNTGAAFGPSALELSSDSENDEHEQEMPNGSDNDDEFAAEEARQNDGGFAPNPINFAAKSMPPPRLPASQRRTPAKPAVVDRLSLKRGSSTSDSALGRTAWAVGPTTGGFKVPSLLRRATTNSGGANDRGVTTSNLSRENSGVKMGGSKKSSLAYQARAEERRAIVEASAKRREENTARIAQMRKNSSALGRGLTGRFE